MEAAGSGAAFFKRGSLFWFAVITVAFGYYTWVAFWPQSIPCQKLGPLGLFTQYLVDNHLVLIRNMYWFAWLIHVGEAIYALILCSKKGITDGWARLLWFLQTFLFGIASLSVLLAYKPYHHKKK
ncbi:transmembrane protein 254 isoform X1 [Phascolarctos cinereus]|uniref:Transmembrane protein 254 n=1 Tax=Phascolarctos cinereus TaxID=38626 RepID=A0A6P5M036_PHACI|nr:transmembrane protein 254 isoform X1 [Phascolarctos cinereus]